MLWGSGLSVAVVGLELSSLVAKTALSVIENCDRSLSRVIAMFFFAAA
jgi:hypothetical protein